MGCPPPPGGLGAGGAFFLRDPEAPPSGEPRPSSPEDGAGQGDLQGPQQRVRAPFCAFGYQGPDDCWLELPRLSPPSVSDVCPSPPPRPALGGGPQPRPDEEPFPGVGAKARERGRSGWRLTSFYCTECSTRFLERPFAPSPLPEQLPVQVEWSVDPPPEGPAFTPPPPWP